MGVLLGQEAMPIAMGAAAVVGLLGPTAYSIETVARADSLGGAIPLAGPAGQASFGPGGRPGGPQNGQGGPGGPGGPVNGQNGQFPGQQSGQLPRPGQQTGQPGGQGGPGGLLNGGTPSDEVVQFLEDGNAGFTWVLATIGANRAAGYQLATDDPVMAIGGFNGTDQWPTLDAFQQMVADGEIHYFLAGGAGPGGGGGPGGQNGNGTSTSSQISSWVQANFETVTVGGTTFYDLTQPTQ